ncbi:MAG: insulinase family protein, partial [Deltaproteobacteria bacterium]|nr:insulinase family protein [Deltaproteobacteria bacterium]
MFFLVPGLAEPPRAQGGVDVSYVLDNGLKVIMVPQPGNPTVTALLMIKAGSGSENGENEYGLAHLMEHMAFKGTHKRGVGEVSAEVENQGGSINAHTSYDETVYHLSLPVDRLELGLDILADIVFNPSYDPKEYALEKEVVVEEIKRSEDSPERVAWTELTAQAFKGRPYEHPVLGTSKTVREATREVALAFHDKFYRPDNAILVITGGFSTEEAPPLVAKYYADLKNPKTPLPAQPKIEKPKRKSEPDIIVIKKDMVQVPKVMIGFNIPSASSPEAIQLDLLSGILDMSRSARLVENVKNKKGLVTDIGTSSMTLLLEGLFMINFETEVDLVNQALTAVMDELSGLANIPPAADELSRARALASSFYLYSQESSNSLASVISSFEMSMGDYRLRDAYIPQWSRMTAADLVKLAGTYFVPENMTVAFMLPSSAPDPDLAEIKKILKSLNPVQPQTVAGATSVFQAMPLKSPAKLYVLRDSTLPLVNIRVAFMGGLLADEPGQEGLSNFMSHVMPMATKEMNSEEFSRFIEGMGAQVHGISGRNSLGLSGNFLSANWETGLDVLIKVLAKPAFAENNMEEFRAETLALLKIQQEQLSELTFNNLRKVLYGQHPYHKNNLGLTEVVAEIKAADLEGFHNRLVRPENMYIVVAGDVEPKLVAEALDNFLAAWKPASVSPGVSTKVLIPEPPEPIKEPQKIKEVKESAQQTHLSLAFLAPAMDDPDRAPMEVLDSYLSGLGGLLFQELRNKKSLAYV